MTNSYDSPTLKVYRSSAGSGKTFTLVKEYLKIVFLSGNSFSFKEILAITFTNKAANEMKNRIIEALERLSNYDQELVPIYSQETGLSKNELAEKSSQILSNILHNYSDFSVFTIDKFTRRLIRSFSQELGLSLNFNVELNEKDFLTNAVKQFLDKIGQDQLLTSFLNEFIEQSLNDSVKSNIETQLSSFQQLIFKGNRDDQLEHLKHISLADFSAIRKHVFNQIQEHEKNNIELANASLSVIDQAGINFNQFHYKDKRFPKIYTTIINNDRFDINNLESWENWVRQDKWMGSKLTESVTANFLAIIPELSANTKEIINISKDIVYLREILKHLTSYSLVNQLVAEVEIQKEKKGVLLISDFNRLISKIIANEPASFIFERIGNRYSHFLFDEFQDTSVRQWNNLVPLVHESLSNGGSNLLVGDAKQAIYRWREGDVGQFVDLPVVSDQLPNSKEINVSFESAHQQGDLKVNRRSLPEIIKFNNDIFSSIVSELDVEFITKAYKGNKQDFSRADGKGYVQISVCNKEEALIENKLEYVLKTIQKNIADGYDYKDISIIVRKNSEATTIAEYLKLQSDPEIPVVSGDSIFLSSSFEIELIISFLSALALADEQSKYKVVEYFLSINKINSIDDFLVDKKNYYLKIDFKKLIQQCIGAFDYDKFNELALVDKVYTIINLLDFNQFNPFITQFLAVLFDYCANNGASLVGFLNFFNEESGRIAVDSGIENAVNIISIHKSKGLQFPVVIIPFGSWLDKENIVNDFSWINGDDLSNLGLPSFVSPMSENALKRLNRQELYQQEKANLYLDNINLYYVATTRAKDRLYMSIDELRNKEKSHIKHFFTSQVVNHANFNEQTNQFVLGNQLPLLKNETLAESMKSSPFVLNSWKEKIHLSYDVMSVSDNFISSKAFGIHLHLAMEKIIYDFETGYNYINHLKASGAVEDAEFELLYKSIEVVQQNSSLRYLFSEENNVFNEVELLALNGEASRIDRLVLGLDSKCTVVDYKTGLPKDKDKEQIISYMNLVGDAGYSQVEGVLIYLPNLKIEKLLL